MAIPSIPYYAGALLSRNVLPAMQRYAPAIMGGASVMNAATPALTPLSAVNGSGVSPAEQLQMLRMQELMQAQTQGLMGQQRFRPMPTEVPMPTNPAEVPLPAMPTGVPMPTNPAEVPLPAMATGVPMPANPAEVPQARVRPTKRAAPAPMQGPPMPSEFNVPGFAKGYANAAPGMSAQQYADQFAGGDLSKVKARQILVDGQLVNDFYTKGLLDGLLGGPAAPQPLQGTPANVPLPPQRPAEFGPSYQGGGLLSNIPFIGGLFGG